MIEPLFWNPLPAAAAWLTQRTGHAFDARTLVDTVAQMGEEGNPASTIVKAMLPRELKFAKLTLRAYDKNNSAYQQMNKHLGLPDGWEYVGVAYPTVAPLPVNCLLDLLMHGTVTLSLLPGKENCNPRETVWLMPWGTEHTATLETCGINRADLLALGDSLALQPKSTTMAAPVVAGNEPVQQVNAMKKSALIAALEYEWPSIKDDISEATRNGLKAAAHTGKHGKWDRDKSRAWAVNNGKVKQSAPVQSLAGAWPGTTTRHTISR